MNLKSLLLTTCLALTATPLLTACQVSHKTKSESDDAILRFNLRHWEIATPCFTRLAMTIKFQAA